ncbi:osmotically inducible protein OsmC [Tenacibaculum sp. SZ-18]|uniref:OsmC family protein n=1 Tax=Tenacibaculum sp. SZ-18 TaxID=754423 RepID=UPI000C2D092D|nr:OsmC family protein [Tenacibaculum sp. SZ-18]AUC16353.1 osmotically inducible protein OsmC [Tenacibaculum sp. SZ-18]
MASNIVTTEWQKNLLFKSDNPNGAQVLMDTSFTNGGNEVGASPKALMLSSLAGCSGLDVVMIAEKMRTSFDNLKIIVEANLTEEHPKYYDKVHVKYLFEGTELDEEKLSKVVNLSIEKYCGVMEMFRQFSTVTTEIIYN